MEKLQWYKSMTSIYENFSSYTDFKISFDFFNKFYVWKDESQCNFLFFS